jgi:hypothetical protein
VNLNFLINNAVRNIPACYSKVFLLREVTGLSIHEMAMAIGDKLKSETKWRQGFARKELEKIYLPLDDYLFRFSEPG